MSAITDFEKALADLSDDDLAQRCRETHEIHLRMDRIQRSLDQYPLACMVECSRRKRADIWLNAVRAVEEKQEGSRLQQAQALAELREKTARKDT